MKYPVDVQIAVFFKRFFSFYISKRIPLEPIVDAEVEANEIWNRNFVNDSASFVHHLDVTVKINLYKDSILSRAIYQSFEESEIVFLKRFLKAGDVFFDIGANVGLFSLHASPIVSAKGAVYSFEPTPRTFQRLQENIALNNFTNVHSQNIGLSNVKDKINFHVSENGFDAWNSFANLEELENSQLIEVQTNTLDDFVLENNIKTVDFIKLDVEGWELNVAKGATQLLASENAPVLLVEFTETNAFAAGYYCGELFDFIKSFGYNWYEYDKESNKLVEQQKKLHYPYENLIAIKNLEVCSYRLSSSILV